VRRIAPVVKSKLKAPSTKPAVPSTSTPKAQELAAERPASAVALASPASALASPTSAREPAASPHPTPEPATPAIESPAPAIASPAPAPESARLAQPTPNPAALKEAGDLVSTEAAATTAPEPARPIDRLHVATAQADARGDLNTLRQLKSSWRAFMQKMGVGPERSRAKREYADCLWGIQSLTGKLQDQKEALQAYRDFLLSAPAGGSDYRSVSRLRELEDALSERR
jgi:hypothetical protein